MRLDKAVALAGYSRSEARAMIARGRVRVRGEIARDAGLSVQIADVSLDGAPLGAEAELYLMLNKPAGVITATEDPRLPTVVSLLPEKYRRRKIGPVGRLDRDVTGLVLLTTDGQLAHRLISPRWKAEKCYRARCEGALGEADARAFAAGIPLGVSYGACTYEDIEFWRDIGVDMISLAADTDHLLHGAQHYFNDMNRCFQKKRNNGR